MADGGGPDVGAEPGWDVFVSYAFADEAWAAWVAWQLQDAGLRVFLRSWEMAAGAHPVAEIDTALREAYLTVAVVSPAYYGSRHAAEWQAAFAADQGWLGERLLPVRVADRPLDGLLAALVFVDLFDVNAPVARERLRAATERALAGARASRARPAEVPVGGRTPRVPVGFPGRAWLRGVPVVEPLSESYLDAGEDAGPLAAIRPRNKVVPFQPRDELDALLDWCDQQPGDTSRPAIRLLTGVGGSGKTHLLAEVTARLTADGWYAGFLRDQLPQDSLDWLAALPGPVAVAVDYAEAARTPDILAAVRALGLRRGGPTCLLLAARTVSGWWTEDLRPALDRDGLASAALHDELPVLHPSPARVYRRARTAFATAAGRANLADGLPPSQGSDGWTTLDVVMLAWLQIHQPDSRPLSRTDLYETVLGHEVGYWARAYAARYDNRPPPTTLLRTAGAAVTLLTPTQLRLDATLGATDLRSDARLRHELTDILTRVLPTDPADGTLALRPDPIGDHLAVTQYQGDPAALATQLAAADDGERLHACVTLTRAADTTLDPSTVQRLATVALERVPDLWKQALTVATAQGGPFLTALIQLAQRPDTPLPVDELARDLPLGHATLRPLALAAATRHATNVTSYSPTADETAAANRADALGDYALRLSEAGERGSAVTVAQEATSHYRHLANTNPAAFLPSLTLSLNNLAAFLAEAGDRGQALPVAQEATDLYRQLADTNPAAFLPNLAMALNNLAVRLSESGERQRALTVAQEATDLCRQLADTNPTAYRPDLAASLNNLATRLAEAGERERALTVAQEATDLYRQLADTNPAAFLPNLAMALNNLALWLAAAGESGHALPVAQEATDLYRQLTDTNPAAFLSDLATSLHNLAARLSEAGELRQAVAVAQEATVHFQQLTDTNPAAFLSDLAMALNTLAIQLAEAGEPERALTVAQEAVGHYRQLADANPAAFLPRLAASLNTLANRLAEAGERERALTVAQEATDLYRQLAEGYPAAFLPSVAASLNTLAARLSEAGERERALSVGQEAAARYRQLAEANPAVLPNLAASLHNLAIQLSEAGDRERALTVAQEATDLRRRLADANPTTFLPDLAASLNNLAARLAEVGERERTLAAAQEAVGHYRQLADANPAAFLPRLAASLNTLANRPAASDGGRALAAAQEATDLRRELAATDPDTFRSDLAASLNNLALRLAEAKEGERALTVAQEATDLYRQLADAHPDTFVPSLAMALNTLANRLAEIGEHERALTIGQEATDLYQQLANTNPATYLPALATSLTNLADQLSTSGRREEALGVFQTDRSGPGAHPAAAGYLLTARAAWRATADDLPGAADDLTAATGQIDTAPPSLATRNARRHLRATARALATAHEDIAGLLARYLPAWALLTLNDTTIDTVNAWAAALSWDDLETLLVHTAAILGEPGPRAEVAALTTLYPDNQASREIATILDEIATEGLDTVLRRHRDTAHFEQIFKGWLATRTWTDSRDYLTTHPDLLTDPRTRTSLEAKAADNLEAAQHLGILDLSATRPIAEVYDIVLDSDVAADEALTAVTTGDIALLSALWNAAPRLAQAPFIGAFLASIRALLTAQPDTATELATTAAAQATDIQRAAAAARLRRLRRTHPDITSTINQMIGSYQTIDEGSARSTTPPHIRR